MNGKVLPINTRVGHRRVNTNKIEGDPRGDYETMVFGGRNRDKVAFEDHYPTLEEAIEGHKRVVDDVKQNPKKYRLGNLF